MRDKLKEINRPINNNKEGALLSKLFRKIVTELSLINRIHFLIDRYTKVAVGSDVKAVKRKTRSSLVNNIVADEMTWKTFMDLMFNLLRVKKCKFTVELTHQNGVVSKHDLMVVKDTSTDDKDDSKDEKNDGI